MVCIWCGMHGAFGKESSIVLVTENMALGSKPMLATQAKRGLAHLAEQLKEQDRHAISRQNSRQRFGLLLLACIGVQRVEMDSRIGIWQKTIQGRAA